MTIHDTIPYKKADIDMNLLKEQVRKVLLPGKYTAINAAAIARRIGRIDDKEELESIYGGSTYQKIRQACKELLEIDLVPVLSCTKGFYIAENEEEIVEYERNIQMRISGMNRIFQATKQIRENWKKEITLFE